MKTQQWTRKILLGLVLSMAGAMVVPLNAVAVETPAVMAQLAAVNVNTADAETIAATMQGIGISRALAIVEYREQHGPFQSIDDLVKVRGVGNSTLEKNRDRISL